MACVLQSPQKLNQRIFISTYRRYSVLLNANGKKKIYVRKEGLNKAVDRRVRWRWWSNKQCRGNNSTDDLSEPGDEMETGSINDNFRNAFYFAAWINLHTFLAEQVASVLSMS